MASRQDYEWFSFIAGQAWRLKVLLCRGDAPAKAGKHGVGSRSNQKPSGSSGSCVCGCVCVCVSAGSSGEGVSSRWDQAAGACPGPEGSPPRVAGTNGSLTSHDAALSAS